MMFSPISILVTTVIVALLISLLVMLRISMKVGKVFTDAEKKQMKDYMDNQRDKGSERIDLSFKIADFLKTTDCKMFFVYGENDPWTGAAIDDPTNVNVKKLVIKGGTHNDAIPTYTDDERKQLMDFVKPIIFLANDAK